MNEQKIIKTRILNGRVVVMGAVWKWGPRFEKQQVSTKLAAPRS